MTFTQHLIEGFPVIRHNHMRILRRTARNHTLAKIIHRAFVQPKGFNCSSIAPSQARNLTREAVVSSSLPPPLALVERRRCCDLRRAATAGLSPVVERLSGGG